MAILNSRIKPVAKRSTPEAVDIDLLIVDDEAVFREMAFRYFKKMGFRVEEAEDGEEAMNVVANRKFDVVVLDILRCGKNKTKTAKALGVNRRSLYRLLEKHNIS